MSIKFAELLHKSSCVILFRNDLTLEDRRWFREQGVDMDNYWNMIVIADVDTLKNTEKDRCIYDHEDDEPRTELEQTDYYIDKLVNINSSSTWHYVKFADGMKAVGVAYH